MAGEVAGVASLAVAPVLDGPPAAARVLATFPAAVYLDAGPLVVAVVTRDAVRLPNAVVLPGTASERPFAGIGAGTPAAVGGGAVVLGPLTVRAARWWDPSLRPAPAEAAAVVARRARTLASLVADAPHRPALDVPPPLVDALRARDLPGVVRHALPLLGLGPGLTPSGDDVLGGLLAALRFTGADAPLAAALGRAVVANAAGRTTSLSATLLRLAAEGHVPGEVARVLDGLAGRAPLEPAVAALLAVGHTSGADAAAGLVAGAVRDGPR